MEVLISGLLRYLSDMLEYPVVATHEIIQAGASFFLASKHPTPLTFQHGLSGADPGSPIGREAHIAEGAPFLAQLGDKSYRGAPIFAS